ncbi:hypothetical protein BDN71DRAFT_1454599, partial [Pleurotus eryngii]
SANHSALSFDGGYSELSKPGRSAPTAYCIPSRAPSNTLGLGSCFTLQQSVASYPRTSSPPATWPASIESVNPARAAPSPRRDRGHSHVLTRQKVDLIFAQHHEENGRRTIRDIWISK